MSIERPEQIVARTFGIARGNDLVLGEKFTDPKTVASLELLSIDEDAQKRFMDLFTRQHGDNPEIQRRLDAVQNLFKNRGQEITRFQAVLFVVNSAQQAYMNGGPL